MVDIEEATSLRVERSLSGIKAMLLWGRKISGMTLRLKVGELETALLGSKYLVSSRLDVTV